MADESGPKVEKEKAPIATNTVRTGIKNGAIVMEFAEPVRAIYMSPIEALIIANALIEKAITIVQNPPSRIIKPN